LSAQTISTISSSFSFRIFLRLETLSTNIVTLFCISDGSTSVFSVSVIVSSTTVSVFSSIDCVWATVFVFSVIDSLSSFIIGSIFSSSGVS
jgi:hypothetical protein